MSPRTRTIPALVSALTLALTVFAGCGAPPKPPPEKPQADPATKWETGGEKAPTPKKCEALDEKCKAASSTKARIAKSTFTIAPVSGWMYAQGDNVTVAQKDDEGAVMAVVGYEFANAKEETKSRETALDAASKEVGVTLPKKKVNWKTADATAQASNITVSMWEVAGATRKGKKGTLLVFTAPVPESKGVVGFGFVPDDDKEGEKIGDGLQTSISSLAPQK